MKSQYSELAKACIGSNKNLIISQCMIDGKEKGFTMSQQIEVKDGDKKITLFLKGGIHIESLNDLYNIRDAINATINKVEIKDQEKKKYEWEN